jgi:hypothetical protein
MRLFLPSILVVLLFTGCAAEEPAVPAAEPPAATVTESAAATVTEPAPAPPAVQTATSENQESGTWAGQVKVTPPVSTFNYVGAESGDWAPMRFANASEAGKKILAVCRNDDECEFTGIVEWLDETPPPDASAVGQIIRVDQVKRLPAVAP